MSKNALLTSIICGLAILLAQPMSLRAANPSLAGSWELTFTPTVPPTPPVIQIPGLATFTRDGSAIETDGTEVAMHATPGHGIWQLMPCLCSFYIQYFSLGVDSDGGLSSKSVTVAIVTPATSGTGTTFSGQYTTTTTGPSGTPPKTTTGTLTGTLIPHPALP
jgi:hypothetical protein